MPVAASVASSSTEDRITSESARRRLLDAFAPFRRRFKETTPPVLSVEGDASRDAKDRVWNVQGACVAVTTDMRTNPARECNVVLRLKVSATLTLNESASIFYPLSSRVLVLVY